MRPTAWKSAVSLCVSASHHSASLHVVIGGVVWIWKWQSRNVGWDFLIGCGVLVLLEMTSLAARGPESPLLKVRPLGGCDVPMLVGAIWWTIAEEPVPPVSLHIGAVISGVLCLLWLHVLQTFDLKIGRALAQLQGEVQDGAQIDFSLELAVVAMGVASPRLVASLTAQLPQGGGGGGGAEAVVEAAEFISKVFLAKRHRIALGWPDIFCLDFHRPGGATVFCGLSPGWIWHTGGNKYRRPQWILYQPRRFPTTRHTSSDHWIMWPLGPKRIALKMGS